MVTTLLKSTLREIRQSLGRFLAILAIATLILESVPNGIALLIIAWLISPVGLPLFAARLLGCIENLRASFWDWLND